MNYSYDNNSNNDDGKSNNNSKINNNIIHEKSDVVSLSFMSHEDGQPQY